MEGPEKRPSSKHGQSNRSTISSRKCVCAVVIAVIITLVLTTVIVVLVMMMAITDEDDCHGKFLQDMYMYIFILG